MEEDNMTRIKETTSRNWKVKGGADANDPKAKWTPEEGKEWKSKPDGDFDEERLKQWVAEMVDWSEMMQEAVLELRERVAIIEAVRANALVELDSRQERNEKRITAIEERVKIST
jgi:hypothetical protein